MNITVYLGANEGNDPALKQAVQELGRWIGESGNALVYGGSRCGLMGEIAESTLNAGGEVTGVEPEFFVQGELQHEGLTELIVTKDMTERKTKMIALGDAFIAFPGGTGTLEEIAEVMSKVSLRHLNAPCILYNLNGYYDGLKVLLGRMIEKGLSSPERQQGIYFVENLEQIKEILYWYASDYCDVFYADRIREQMDPSADFAVQIIENADLDKDDYLYEFGEYISRNELGTAHHLRNLPQETLQKMADVYTEGYRIGFINTGKDLSKKSIVNIRYSLGFEKVIRIAIENFRKMGLKPVIYRAASSVITKREHHKIGYYGAIANQQYEYDHRQDQALFMDKRYVERKLEVMKTVFEQNKEMAAGVAGPAVMEIFGETPFSPEAKTMAPAYDEAQRELDLLFSSRSGQITNEYIKGEERSFTIVAYPVPEIGADYAKIFDEVIKINTLDAKLYEKVQQTMIDALDQGTCVHVRGKGENQTDITVQLYHLKDAQKETIFENCVADVNIPVGEVFTSPVLEGTNGILHVSKVYLDGLQYENLKLTFQDGKITDYTCTNFEDEAQNKKYIYDNVLKNHETLPLGEFAIGTNTTAYVAAKKFNIEDKMPILIAEKTGPHFAVGDTCYSWSEEIRVYNPNGKEIVAKDNSCSLLRKEDVSKAYFNCHTDITVPYKELEEISVVTNEGKDIILLKDGRFVLPGTEVLNEPLDEAGF